MLSWRRVWQKWRSTESKWSMVRPFSTMWECMKAKSRPLYRGWKLSWCPTPPPNAYARKDTCTTTSRVTSCCALSNSTWLKVQGLGFTLNDPHPDPMNWGRQPHKCKHPECTVVLSLMVGRSASRMRGGRGRAGEGLNSGICKRRRGPHRGGMDDGEDRTGSQQLRSLERNIGWQDKASDGDWVGGWGCGQVGPGEGGGQVGVGTRRGCELGLGGKGNGRAIHGIYAHHAL